METPEQHPADSMTREEMVEFLQDHGRGVLSLSDGADAYGVPVSFGYVEEETDDAIYLSLNRFGEDSEKLEVLEETNSASLVAYDAESSEKWRSVVVTGQLRDFGAVGEGVSTSNLVTEEHVREVLEEHAWFPQFADDAEEITASRLFYFSIEDMSGRQGAAYL